MIFKYFVFVFIFLFNYFYLYLYLLTFVLSYRCTEDASADNIRMFLDNVVERWLRLMWFLNVILCVGFIPSKTAIDGFCCTLPCDTAKSVGCNFFELFVSDLELFVSK